MFTKDDGLKLSTLDLDNYPSIPQIAIAVAGIKELDLSKLPGSDKISRKLLIATELSPCLSLIFTASFCQGIVTQDWKQALVTPLFIYGNRMEASKYCPILLNCICCEILEHIIHTDIMTNLPSYILSNV